MDMASLRKKLKDARLKTSSFLQVILVLLFAIAFAIGFFPEISRDTKDAGHMIAIVIGYGMLLLLLGAIVRPALRDVLTEAITHSLPYDRIYASLCFVLTVIFFAASFIWGKVPPGPIHFVEFALFVCYFSAVSGSIWVIVAGVLVASCVGSAIFGIIAIAYLLLILEQNASVLSRLVSRR